MIKNRLKKRFPWLRYIKHPSMYFHERRALKRLREVEEASLEDLPRLEKGDPKLVVSLTSHGSRISTVHLAVRSVLMQSVIPDAIVLYLDNESSDVELPSSLLELQDVGLQIRKGVPNLRAHNKYHYAMQEYPNACIVTIDDDVVYPGDLLESLWSGHQRYPDSIVSCRVHRIVFDEHGEMRPYSEWEHEWKGSILEDRKSFVATGVGGVLYPAGVFGPIAFDVSLVQSLAPYCDDIWLKMMATYYKVPIKYAPKSTNQIFEIPNTQDVALVHMNVSGGENDREIACLIDYFGFERADFNDEAQSG